MLSLVPPAMPAKTQRLVGIPARNVCLAVMAANRSVVPANWYHHHYHLPLAVETPAMQSYPVAAAAAAEERN